MLHQRFDLADGGDQHVAENHEVGFGGEWAVAGNDLGGVVGNGQHFFRCGDESIGCTTAGIINKRIEAIEKCVTHVDDIGFTEKDDAVAIGVRARHVEHKYFVAIDVECYVLRERYRRQAFLRHRRFFSFEVVDDLVARQTLAYVVVRDDHRATLAQVDIAAGVVAMPVRVDQERDGFGCNCLDRGFNLRRERGELIVDHEHGVVADR